MRLVIIIILLLSFLKFENNSHTSHHIVYYDTTWTKMIFTTYSPTKKQCGNNKGITASGLKINLKNPLGSRLVAVTRDLKRDVLYDFFSPVFIRGNLPIEYHGKWTVADLTNKKLKKRIDLCVGVNDKNNKYYGEVGTINKHNL